MAPDFNNEEDPLIPEHITLFILGVIYGFSYLFLSLVGPLIIAAKNKKSYEITMGGSMIAVCIALPYLIGSQIGPMVVSLGAGLSEDWQRFIVALVYYTAAAPLFIDAWKEYKSMRTCCRKQSTKTTRIFSSSFTEEAESYNFLNNSLQ